MRTQNAVAAFNAQFTRLSLHCSGGLLHLVCVLFRSIGSRFPKTSATAGCTWHCRGSHLEKAGTHGLPATASHSPTRARLLFPIYHPVRRFRLQSAVRVIAIVHASTQLLRLPSSTSAPSRACIDIHLSRACLSQTRNNNINSAFGSASPHRIRLVHAPSPLLVSRDPSCPLALPKGLAWSTRICSRSLFAEGELLVATCGSNDKCAAVARIPRLHSSTNAAPRTSLQTHYVLCAIAID
jgi:hypothetical protein